MIWLNIIVIHKFPHQVYILPGKIKKKLITPACKMEFFMLVMLVSSWSNHPGYARMGQTYKDLMISTYERKIAATSATQWMERINTLFKVPVHPPSRVPKILMVGWLSPLWHRLLCYFLSVFLKFFQDFFKVVAQFFASLQVFKSYFVVSSILF